MSKTNDIDYAIRETLKVHPDFFDVIFRALQNGVGGNLNVRNFTHQNHARERITDADANDFILFILEQLHKIYLAGEFFLATRNPTIFDLVRYYDCLSLVEKFKNPNLNAFINLESNSSELLTAVYIVMHNLYKNSSLRFAIETAANNQMIYSRNEKELFYNKIILDLNSQKDIADLEVNYAGWQNCVQDVLNGQQLKNVRNQYALSGNLFASQDVGKRRINQEDSVLIMTHPQEASFKILAVADGMGGIEQGDYASSFTIRQLITWFESLPAEMFYYPKELSFNLENKIREISSKIHYEKNTARPISGTTLTIAVVTEKDTVVESVGDSRAYSVSNGVLRLITNDDSFVWQLFSNNGQITTETLDDMRFHRESNRITAYVGAKDLTFVQKYIIPNQNYDRILLFSDGVTDALATSELAILSTYYKVEEVTKRIVDCVTNKESYRRAGESFEYRGVIPAGHDNASAVMYSRR